MVSTARLEKVQIPLVKVQVRLLTRPPGPAVREAVTSQPSVLFPSTNWTGHPSVSHQEWPQVFSKYKSYPILVISGSGSLLSASTR